MNVFLFELRQLRRSTIIWTLALMGAVVFLMSMFPAFSRDVDAFAKLLAGFPEAVKKALGINIEAIGSLLGYYAYIFTYITLVGAIQAMTLGVSLVSKETRDKTADFLLTKPISRSRIITAKLVAALISMLIVAAGYLAAASAMAYLVSSAAFSYGVFFMISITLLFVQLVFFALGVLVSVLAKKIRAVLSVSLGTVFTFFIINLLSLASGDDKLRYLTPFQYFDPAQIRQTSSYESTFVLLSAVFTVAAIVASYVLYKKKDIHAV